MTSPSSQSQCQPTSLKAAAAPQSSDMNSHLFTLDHLVAGIRVTKRYGMSGCWLFALDVRSLDDGPPFLGLGFLQCGERLGRLLVAWRNLHTHSREALANRRISQRINKRSLDRGDQTLR